MLFVKMKLKKSLKESICETQVSGIRPSKSMSMVDSSLVALQRTNKKSLIRITYLAPRIFSKMHVCVLNREAINFMSHQSCITS